MKKRFGEVLVERGLIAPAQLSDALALQRQRGMRLGAALVACGHLTEGQLVKTLGELLQIEVVDLDKIVPAPMAVSLVKANFASEHDVLPYAIEQNRGRTRLLVAMADPMNYSVIDELGFIADAKIIPRLAKPSAIRMAVRSLYGLSTQPLHYAPPVRLDSSVDGATMTIIRGGDEQTVNTATGKVVSPFIKPPAPVPVLQPTSQAPGQPQPQPQHPVPAAPQNRTPPPREHSTLLLTEEVTDDIPVDGINQRVPQPPPNHLRLGNEAPPSPIPLTDVKRSAAPPNPYFNEALGALIDAAGDAVDAEAFLRLERKFWALMRVLAKKGVLTNEDFLRELGEEDWR